MKKIALLPGDYIGPWTVEIQQKILETYGVGEKFTFETYLIGLSAVEKYGKNLPEETVDGACGADAVAKGPSFTLSASDPRIIELTEKWGNINLDSANVQFRKHEKTKLRVNHRPVKRMPHMRFNLRGWKKGVTVHTFRELLWGAYGGKGVLAENNSAWRDLYQKQFDIQLPEDTAIGFDFAPRSEYLKFAEAVFAHSEKLGLKVMYVTNKENIQKVTHAVFVEVFKEVAQRYPNIHVEYPKIDAFYNRIGCGYIDQDCALVTLSDIGDHKSDLNAGFSMGAYAPSSEYGESVFMTTPSHGTANAMVGTDHFNMIPTLLSGELMLRYFDLHEGADELVKNLEEYSKRNKKYVRKDRSVVSTNDLLDFMFTAVKA